MYNFGDLINVNDCADIPFLVAYAALSLVSFAVLHHLLIPVYGQTHPALVAEAEALDTKKV